MGESNTSASRQEAEVGVSRSLAAPPARTASEDERPLSLLVLCALMAAGAFGLPMWANALLWEPPPVVDGIESSDQMQSMVRKRVVLRPPSIGAVLPELRAEPAWSEACIDPGAW